jgi:hypothetical protein
MEGATPINALPPSQTSRDQTSNYTDILKALEAETYAEPPPASTLLPPTSTITSDPIGGDSGNISVDPHTAELHRQLQELRADMRRERSTTVDPPRSRQKKSGHTSHKQEEDDVDNERSVDIRNFIGINKYTMIVMVIIFVMFKFGAPRLASLSPRLFISPSGRLNLFGTAAVSILGGIAYKASTIYV